MKRKSLLSIFPFMLGTIEINVGICGPIVDTLIEVGVASQAPRKAFYTTNPTKGSDLNALEYKALASRIIRNINSRKEKLSINKKKYSSLEKKTNENYQLCFYFSKKKLKSEKKISWLTRTNNFLEGIQTWSDTPPKEFLSRAYQYLKTVWVKDWDDDKAYCEFFATIQKTPPNVLDPHYPYIEKKILEDYESLKRGKYAHMFSHVPIGPNPRQLHAGVKWVKCASLFEITAPDQEDVQTYFQEKAYKWGKRYTQQQVTVVLPPSHFHGHAIFYPQKFYCPDCFPER